MTGETTSLVRANSARGEWQQFRAFLRHPRLPLRAAGWSGASFVAVLRMLALDLMLMLVLVLAAGIAVFAGVEIPRNTLETLEMGWPLVLGIVIAAPLGEEIVFRGWLSGRPGHLIAVPLVPAGLVLGAALVAHGTAAAMAAGIAVMAAGVILAGFALWYFRKARPLRWFARAFPFFFALSTLAFGLVHMLNYEEGTLAFLLPLVLPQIVAGAIFGYARVRYGLWASILLHALHNGSAVGLVLLADPLAG